MSEADAEFVTVAEAARRLGISERQARHYAGRLPDSDRQTPDRGPVTVRLAAVAAQRGNEANSGTPDAAINGNGMQAGPMPDSGTPDAGRRPDTLRVSPEMVAQLKDEVAYLRGALERSQTLQLQTLTTLDQAQRRAAELEERERKLIASMPTHDTPPEPPGSRHAGGSAEGDPEAAHPDGKGEQEGEKRRRPWRRPWWRPWWRPW